MRCMEEFEKEGKGGKTKACKASSFKELRGLNDTDAEHLLNKVLGKELVIQKLNHEAKQLKQMKEVQQQLIATLALDTWEEFCEK